MGIYLEDAKLDSVLENYFEEDNYAIFESCMIELLAEEKKSQEEKDAAKQEKLEKRIEKAHNALVAKVSSVISNKAEKFSSFKLDCHQATKKELVLYLGNNLGAGALGGLLGTGIGTGAGAVAGYGKEELKAGVKGGLQGTAIGLAVVGGLTLIEELAKKKMYKELYTTKVYGIDDKGKEKLIGWWLSVEVKKSDLSSDVRKLIK